LLFPFIRCVFWEGDEVAHFAEAGTNPGAVEFFNFVGREIGGEMGEHVVVNEVVVSGQDDFGHDVAFLAEVSKAVLGSQVIEAEIFHIGSMCGVVIRDGSVTPDDFKAGFLELKGDISTGL